MAYCKVPLQKVPNHWGSSRETQDLGHRRAEELELSEQATKMNWKTGFQVASGAPGKNKQQAMTEV